MQRLPYLFLTDNLRGTVFYVALVALVKVAALSFVVWRLWLARNREAQRADSNARGWQETRRLLVEVQAERNANALALTGALVRMAEIRATIQRRPPRRKWLRIAYRVGFRWPA